LTEAAVRSRQHSVLRKNGYYLILGGITIAAILVAWWSTYWGVKVGYDSLFYLTAAQNFLKGLGLTRLGANGSLLPLTHYPPLYSLYVAVFHVVFPNDVMMAARWGAIFSYGAGGIVFSLLTRRYTRSNFAGLLGALAFLASPVILNVSLAAFSEGLYLVWMMLALAWITKMLEKLDWKSVTVAAVFSALACLTRYVGVSVIGLGGLAIWLLSRQPLKKKLLMTLWYGLVSVFPLGVWYLRNWQLTGSFSNRVFGVHLPPVKELIAAGELVTTWFFPTILPAGLRLACFMLLTGCILALMVTWRRRLLAEKTSPLGDAAFRFVLLNGIYIFIYWALLWVSRAFFDYSTRWETRILSPLYINLLLIGLVTAWNGLRLESSLPRRIGAISLGFLFVSVFAVLSVRFLLDTRSQGSGFASRAWRQSETIQLLRTLPEATELYSNEAAGIYFQLGRPAFGLPERYDSVKDQENPDYLVNLEAMKQALLASNAVLVIIKPYRHSDVYPPLEKLLEGLELYRQTADGEIYTRPSFIP
jgi:hypothetical protein